jgi:hypothetical protein
MGFGTFLNGDMGYCDDLRGTSLDIIIFLYKNLFFGFKILKNNIFFEFDIIKREF